MSRAGKIAIRRLSAVDKPFFAEALELLNRTQGRDMFAPTYLDEHTAKPSSLVLATFRDEKIVGVGVAELISNYDYYLPFDPHINADLKDRVVGSFSTLCVHEDLQGQGLGYQMSLKRLEWLRSQGCEVVLGVSWVSGLAHTSDRLFDRMGFRAVRRVEQFFHQSSLERAFICPACGGPPCTCAAILYRQELFA